VTTPLVIGALLVAGLFLARAPHRRKRRQARVHWLLALAVLGAAAFVFQGRLGLPQKVAAVKSLTTQASLVTKQQKAAAPAPKKAAALTQRTAAAPTQQKAAAPTHTSGSVLNDAGFALLRAGNYRAAVPLLELAVQRLHESGSIVDAYALYNLAYARFALGRCDGVLTMLDLSQKRQGHRSEIDRLRAKAQKRCAGR
jgi:tetratricopeptide (TPR) repeat protein